MFLKSLIGVGGVVLLLVGCGGDTPKIESNSSIRVPTPTATILPSPTPIKIDDTLTDEQRDVIELHNQKRELYFSDSPLIYSMELESEAEKYANILANSGKFEHDTQNNHKNSYGENLYASSKNRPLTIEDAMPHWFDDEEPHYHYANGSCDSSFQCGHYTQIIWQDTKEVGCATAQYKEGRFKGGYIYVCKYYKAGNISLNGKALKPYCQSYDRSDIYGIDKAPSDISINGKKFQIELIVEDRIECTREDNYNSAIEFSSDGSKAIIRDFQIFNNGNYALTLEFNSILVDGNSILLEGINQGKDIYMKIELIGKAQDYYSANIEWNGFDKSKTQYSRSMLAKLYW